MPRASVRSGPTLTRRMYPWVPLALGLAVFAGFAPTYYLKFAFAQPALPWLVHLHGLLMSAWVLLFASQTWLVARQRVDLHRRLGVAGVALVALIPMVGSMTAIEGARLGHSPGPPPLVFLTVPLFDVLVFTALAVAALALRRRTDWHRRLMLTATLNLLPPALGRFAPLYLHLPGLPFAFGVTDLLLLGAATWDTWQHRRLHPAFGWGIGVTLAWEVAAVALGSTAGWLHVAQWLTGTG
ncbi:hypothetical protein [Rhodanobacter ginsengiterrae]|uniref:hypothetical protein n=1 Tax=Rhodanobacter ginsengiterrae TaxID=2008451 RepID=UPI003CE83C8C